MVYQFSINVIHLDVGCFLIDITSHLFKVFRHLFSHRDMLGVFIRKVGVAKGVDGALLAEEFDETLVEFHGSKGLFLRVKKQPLGRVMLEPLGKYTFQFLGYNNLLPTVGLGGLVFIEDEFVLG